MSQMNKTNQDSTFMLIKDRYNTEVLTVFECMSTYFADIFYNHLYKEAIIFKEDSKMPQIFSITDGYKHALRAYGGAINKSNFYKQSIKGIITQLQIEFGCMVTYRESISLIVNRFIPKSWIISSEEESKILRRIFKECSNNIIYQVAKDFIPLIIDQRNAITIENLQDSFLQILLHQKENTESELNIYIHNTSKSPTLDVETMVRFKNEYKKILNENMTLKIMITKMKKIIINKHKNLDSCNNKIKNLEIELEHKPTQQITNSNIFSSHNDYDIDDIDKQTSDIKMSNNKLSNKNTTWLNSENLLQNSITEDIYVVNEVEPNHAELSHTNETKNAVIDIHDTYGTRKEIKQDFLQNNIYTIESDNLLSDIEDNTSKISDVDVEDVPSETNITKKENDGANTNEIITESRSAKYSMSVLYQSE